MLSISCNQLHFAFANGDSPWPSLTFSWSGQKLGIVGDNGSGKSTLLHLLTGANVPAVGRVNVNGACAVFPQDFSPFTNQPLSRALGVEAKLLALNRILAGDGSPEDLLVLDDDWEIESDLEQRFAHFDLPPFQADRLFGSFSGGEQTKLMLIRLQLQSPDWFALDEPTNHLDYESRQNLHQWIGQSEVKAVVVSHDRELLRQVDQILELSHAGAKLYGGNYDFYMAEKAAELAKLESDYAQRQKDLRKSRLEAQLNREKQERHQSRGAKQKKKRGVDKMALNYFKGQGEATLRKQKKIQQAKVDARKESVGELAQALNYQRPMKIEGLELKVKLAKRVLFAENLNYSHVPENDSLWETPLTFTVNGGERLMVRGANGSGKSTLLKLISGSLSPQSGKIQRNFKFCRVLDQHLSFLEKTHDVMSSFQASFENPPAEHELRMRLGQFLFQGESVFKSVAHLSGGERCRLALACTLVSDLVPDLLILDEPTNHLDLKTKFIFEAWLEQYPGTMIIVTHSQSLLEKLSSGKKVEYLHLE